MPSTTPAIDGAGRDHGVLAGAPARLALRGDTLRGEHEDVAGTRSGEPEGARE